MDKNYERIAELMSLFLAGNISEEEMAELKQWQESFPHLEYWLQAREDKINEIRNRYDHYISEDILADWTKIRARVQPLRDKNKRGNQWWMAAAAITVIISLAIWWNQRAFHSTSEPVVAAADSARVIPGGEVAYLTLSDGETVKLGEENQTIKEGQLEMEISGNTINYKETDAAKVYEHTLTVPPGGTYSIRLADGTMVWLNADSELKFPSAFTKGERTVYLRGEAFFEVAKDAARPFRVHVASTTIEALGTAFNINTHLIPGRVKTILTEGKIRVADGARKQVITEGYATISGQGTIDAELADPEEALAWKDGYFYFTGKNLREILEDVARWYNVDVKIEKPVSAEKYKGGIKRTESIEAVCKMLNALTGSRINIENRTLILK